MGITLVGNHEYAVELRDVAITAHRVVVPPALTADLGLDPDDEEALIVASFDFLLEREPSTSILPRFDLDIIGRYFPEYRATMRQRLGGR